MKWFRSIGAVLSAPVIYGVVCVPSVGVLMSSYADLLNEQGGTFDVTLTLMAELIQLVVLVICGYISALIAGREELKHSLVVTAVMLAIAIGVQASFWESMLVWHHFVFFGCVLVGIHLGTRLRLRQKGTSVFPGALITATRNLGDRGVIHRLSRPVAL